MTFPFAINMNYFYVRCKIAYNEWTNNRNVFKRYIHNVKSQSMHNKKKRNTQYWLVIQCRANQLF